MHFWRDSTNFTKDAYFNSNSRFQFNRYGLLLQNELQEWIGGEFD